MSHSIIPQSNLFYLVLSSTALHCTALHCTALSSLALHCTALSSLALHCPLLLFSCRFGDAYCEFPKRLRVIEEVRAMVKTIMTTDDSAGTSLHHTHTHSLARSLTHSTTIPELVPHTTRPPPLHDTPPHNFSS